MNLHILTAEVQKFIASNLHGDITSLILKGSPFPKVTIQEICEQIEAKKRCQHKLIKWFESENIYYPNRLNIEQTSSEITAKYKSKLVSGEHLVDTTGGFGVDVFYFSKAMLKVTHCELNNSLSKIVTHNFNTFQKKNIQCIRTNGIDFITENQKKYDWIYSDPSRRNELKGKVFLLKDCLPNIPKHLNDLFQKTTRILLKLSPVLDITSAIRELEYIKEIHVVAVGNEVKELLFILEKGYIDSIKLTTVNISKNEKQLFQSTFPSTVQATYNGPKTFLYEPNSAILKSGAFDDISHHFKISKLHKHSHLYTSDTLIEFPGRRFKILHQTTYNRKKILQFIPEKKANITTRNFPDTVAQIRKRTKLQDGGNKYLFFTTLQDDSKIVLICEKV